VGSWPRHGQTSAAPELEWYLFTLSGPNLTNETSSLLYHHLTNIGLVLSEHGTMVLARDMTW